MVLGMSSVMLLRQRTLYFRKWMQRVEDLPAGISPSPELNMPGKWALILKDTRQKREKVAQQSLDLLKGFGGRGKAGIQKATQWVQDQYGAVNNIVKGSGAKLGDRVSNIMDSPIVQDYEKHV